MSGESAESEEPLVVIARAVKTKGLKGQIVAEVLTDFPDRFAAISRLFVVNREDERRRMQLESHSFHKDRVVLKFVGVDTVESASELIGCDFALPEAERVELGQDEYYDWELEGCGVESVTGERVGVVKGLMRTGGVDLLVVERDRKQESLIPMVGSMIRIDKQRKTIVVDPPEGLLEL